MGQDNSPTHLCFLEKKVGDHDHEHLGLNSKNSEPGTLLDAPANGSLTSIQNGDMALDSMSYKSNNSTQIASVCLPAKPIVRLNETLNPKCYSPHYSCPLPKISTDVPEHSASGDVVIRPGNEDQIGSHCYVARILTQYHSFRIIQIHRRQRVGKESVLFVGDVWDLRNGVHASDYVTRNWWLSEVLGYSRFAMIPVHLESVLLLTAGLSAGLAVVNMLPIYGLDGYHIVEAIVRVIVGKGWEYRKISRLVNYISWAGVFVALLTVFCSILQSF